MYKKSIMVDMDEVIVVGAKKENIKLIKFA